jgi:hypothetical protein
MFINRSEILRGILIGSSVFLCSSILIITLYLLYRYRKESLKKENLNSIEIEQRNVSLTNQIRSNSIETTSTIIEELMRKSLQLAKTAEKVADEKEKRISLKDKTQIDLQF